MSRPYRRCAKTRRLIGSESVLMTSRALWRSYTLRRLLLTTPSPHPAAERSPAVDPRSAVGQASAPRSRLPLRPVDHAQEERGHLGPVVIHFGLTGGLEELAKDAQIANQIVERSHEQILAGLMIHQDREELAER
jgi:hypothetical protein